jgi:predicted O-linked N-acetylglucosamine transferase (SPINDLY family)
MKDVARAQALCEWDGLALQQQRARQCLAQPGAGTIAPFLLLSMPGITAAEQRRCADLWMQARLQASQARRAVAPLALQREARTRIRLAYLSCDFHQHATALLMVEMLEAHCQERFELFAYSYGNDDGRGMRQRLERSFEHFVDIRGLSMDDAARRIHADGIDILVDLKGYTQATRTEILTWRPAPVQVSFLGYPGTLGGDFCDYLITDPFVTPPASAGDYSEALAYLPHSYQPRGCRAGLGVRPSRAGAGLPPEGFVFCCFNQAYKFTPAMFDIWCRLLWEVPDSVLWLLADRRVEGNLRNEMTRRGVSPARLVFAPPLSQEAHLARLPLADLMLDTLPYNAHTTASDALWAGVPLVTCAGQTFASRVAGSLLGAAGLPELVVYDLDSYHDLALALAQDAPRLAALRARLAANRASAPLFDVTGYTRAIEALYEAMLQRWLAGQAPAMLHSPTARPGLHEGAAAA